MWIGEVDMKTWMRCFSACFDGVLGAVDVIGMGPGQRGDHRALHLRCDPGDRLEVAVGRCGEPGLDDVYPQPRQLMGDGQLLVRGQGDPRRLLPIAQRGIEDDQLSSLRSLRIG